MTYVIYGFAAFGVLSFGVCIWLGWLAWRERDNL